MNFKFIVHQLCEQLGFLALIIVSAHEYPAKQDIRELMSPKTNICFAATYFLLRLITLQKLMHISKNIRFTDSIAYAILMSQVF